MNGAESLVRTLLANELNVCFANPGTSEMHFVAALDRVNGMRCVLNLFEGGATGAADGYYRMTGKPAATLLHLGPGLSNGSANLHNARKAGSGIVNIVGQHATYHSAFNSPLASDVEAIARPVSDWVHTSATAEVLSRDAALAVSVARQKPGKIATLLLPADTAWRDATDVLSLLKTEQSKVVDAAMIDIAARTLNDAGAQTLLLISQDAVSEEGLRFAQRIAGRTRCRVMAQCFNSRIARGRSRFSVARIPSSVDAALEVLKPFKNIILVGAEEPVAFFAYPDRPSLLKPSHCEVTLLCRIGDDAVGALAALSDAVGAKQSDVEQQSHAPLVRPVGPLEPASVAQAIAITMPEGAIVVDESVTLGRSFFQASAGAAPHDWLQNMGASIGFATPVALGAAIACPDRRVVCMTGDGSGMYTLQTLWTHARESLNITTIVFANRTYEILKGEFEKVDAGSPGRTASDMMSLDRPSLDWVQLAKGMGVEATKVETAQDFVAALEASYHTAGPRLIEVVL